MASTISKTLDSVESIIKELHNASSDADYEELSIKYKKKKTNLVGGIRYMLSPKFFDLCSEATKRNIKISMQDMSIFGLICENIVYDTNVALISRKKLIDLSGVASTHFNRSIRRLIKAGFIYVDNDMKLFRVNADILAYGHMKTLDEQGLLTK